MLPFPIDELMDEQKCYDFLTEVLHPEGLSCPEGHPLPPEQAPHDRARTPLVKYRCRQCGRVFNILTGTVLSRIRYSCAEIVLLLRGIVQAQPTTLLARELGRDYGTLLTWRHRIQKQGLQNRVVTKLSDDEEIEVDEVYQNSGHKGPTDEDEAQTPPRQRANKQRGRGTLDTDRPPLVGQVGRQTNHLRLDVCPDAQQETVMPLVKRSTPQGATIYSDEAHTYRPLDETDREHHTVRHGDREWARDDDGDGLNEVHTNTIEGLWTHWRNFIRSFRGVHQKYLPQYAFIFEWIHNLEVVTHDFLRSLLIPDFTLNPI